MKEKAIYTAILIAILIVILIGQYSTWRMCSDEGGTTVRGVFGLECIRP